VKDIRDEGRSAGVSKLQGVAETKQAGEAPKRWEWVERSVWTEQMLAALERGMKGGKWFSLMDKVYAEKNLQASWEKVRQNKGSKGADGQSVHDFANQADRELKKLGDELREGIYEPRPVKRVYIPKPGSKEDRPLGIPSVRDRVVQAALKNVMEPIFEKKFTEHSYGFRSGRGCKDALRRVQGLLDGGHTWVLDADIEKYFDTIPHEPLMEEIEKEVSDGKVLGLTRAYLKQGILEDFATWTPGEGTPQGAVISPLLANIYLHPVDIEMMKAGLEMVRYADDLVVLCRSEAEAQEALKLLRWILAERGLNLHPTKTRIVNAQERGGFDFLGYHFERGCRWPRSKSLKKLKDAIRAKTKRTNGNSLAVTVTDINRTLRGWFEYYKHSRKETFPHIDGWVRMRLRSILRKRQGKRGRGRGSDHQTWPNSYFMEMGLFTTTKAHMLLCRPR
jgi:RNA-directed DNA polymerase